jgi:hypothetical protein
MAHYKPDMNDFIPLILLKPTTEMVSGVLEKTFPTVENALGDNSNIFYGSFTTYGGTERDINGIYSLIDTANILTWYRPDITTDCRIAVAETGDIYDIINQPENLNMRNQYLKFKVKRFRGGT